MAKMLVLLFISIVNVSAMRSAVRAHNRFEGATKDNVVSKVIEMLGTEKSKIAADLEKEGAAMEEYMDYCDDEAKAKDFSIRDADRVIEDTAALIEDNSAQIDALEEEIAEIGVQMADRQDEHDKLKKQRDESHEEFKKREAEQQVMLDELIKMEAALKRQIEAMTTPPPVQSPAAEEEAAEGEAPAEGAAALLQIGSNARSSMMLAEINRMRVVYSKTLSAMMKDPSLDPTGRSAFLQVQEDPVAGAEDSGTADNLAAFEGLKKKAAGALQREREQEKKEFNEFMVEKQSLMGAMKLFNNKLDDANEDKNQLSEEKGQAEGENKMATESKATDEKALAELQSTCNAAATAWEMRKKDATAEQNAIQKAMDILSSRVKVFLLQEGSKRAKVETGKPVYPVRQQLISHFRSLGQKLHSISMLNMVSAMSVTPMEKIKGLITDMIAKLEKEAAEAASTHAFCQEENKKNKDAKEKTQGELDKTNSRLESATAKKQGLEDRIAQLAGEIKDIQATNAEAVKIRADENAAFLKNEADFKEAAAAVDDAVEVLKEYYGDVGAFVQEDSEQPAAPPKLGGAKSASAGGILSILDMMSDEFSTTVEKLQREEREAVEAFEKLTNENEVALTQKEMEIKMSESQVSSLTEAIGDYETDKAETTKTMDAILAYIDKLKPTCENRVVPYAERKAKREAEIEGLKEAFQILVETADAMNANFLQKPRHL